LVEVGADRISTMRIAGEFDLEDPEDIVAPDAQTIGREDWGLTGEGTSAAELESEMAQPMREASRANVPQFSVREPEHENRRHRVRQHHNRWEDL
jgi:hypothetical protein